MSRYGSYRRFNATDWQSFSGAERFSGNQDPFIYNKTMNDGHVELIAIVDRNGCEINFYSDGDEEVLCYSKKLICSSSMRAEGYLRQLIKVLEEYSYAPDLTYELDHPSHKATEGFEDVYTY